MSIDHPNFYNVATLHPRDVEGQQEGAYFVIGAEDRQFPDNQAGFRTQSTTSWEAPNPSFLSTTSELRLGQHAAPPTAEYQTFYSDKWPYVVGAFAPPALPSFNHWPTESHGVPMKGPYNEQAIGLVDNRGAPVNEMWAFVAPMPPGGYGAGGGVGGGAGGGGGAVGGGRRGRGGPAAMFRLPPPRGAKREEPKHEDIKAERDRKDSEDDDGLRRGREGLQGGGGGEMPDIPAEYEIGDEWFYPDEGGPPLDEGRRGEPFAPKIAIPIPEVHRVRHKVFAPIADAREEVPVPAAFAIKPRQAIAARVPAMFPARIQQPVDEGRQLPIPSRANIGVTQSLRVGKPVSIPFGKAPVTTGINIGSGAKIDIRQPQKDKVRAFVTNVLDEKMQSVITEEEAAGLAGVAAALTNTVESGAAVNHLQPAEAVASGGLNPRLGADNDGALEYALSMKELPRKHYEALRSVGSAIAAGTSHEHIMDRMREAASAGLPREHFNAISNFYRISAADMNSLPLADPGGKPPVKPVKPVISVGDERKDEIEKTFASVPAIKSAVKKKVTGLAIDTMIADEGVDPATLAVKKPMPKEAPTLKKALQNLREAEKAGFSAPMMQKRIDAYRKAGGSQDIIEAVQAAVDKKLESPYNWPTPVKSGLDHDVYDLPDVQRRLSQLGAKPKRRATAYSEELKAKFLLDNPSVGKEDVRQVAQEVQQNLPLKPAPASILKAAATGNVTAVSAPVQPTAADKSYLSVLSDLSNAFAEQKTDLYPIAQTPVGRRRAAPVPPSANIALAYSAFGAGTSSILPVSIAVPTQTTAETIESQERATASSIIPNQYRRKSQVTPANQLNRAENRRSSNADIAAVRRPAPVGAPPIQRFSQGGGGGGGGGPFLPDGGGGGNDDDNDPRRQAASSIPVAAIVIETPKDKMIAAVLATPVADPIIRVADSDMVNPIKQAAVATPPVASFEAPTSEPTASISGEVGSFEGKSQETVYHSHLAMAEDYANRMLAQHSVLYGDNIAENVRRGLGAATISFFNTAWTYPVMKREYFTHTGDGVIGLTPLGAQKLVESVTKQQIDASLTGTRNLASQLREGRDASVMSNILSGAISGDKADQGMIMAFLDRGSAYQKKIYDLASVLFTGDRVADIHSFTNAIDNLDMQSVELQYLAEKGPRSKTTSGGFKKVIDLNMQRYLAFTSDALAELTGQFLAKHPDSHLSKVARLGEAGFESKLKYKNVQSMFEKTKAQTLYLNASVMDASDVEEKEYGLPAGTTRGPELPGSTMWSYADPSAPEQTVKIMQAPAEFQTGGFFTFDDLISNKEADEPEQFLGQGMTLEEFQEMEDAQLAPSTETDFYETAGMTKEAQDIESFFANAISEGEAENRVKEFNPEYTVAYTVASADAVAAGAMKGVTGNTLNQMSQHVSQLRNDYGYNQYASLESIIHSATPTDAQINAATALYGQEKVSNIVKTYATQEWLDATGGGYDLNEMVLLPYNARDLDPQELDYDFTRNEWYHVQQDEYGNVTYTKLLPDLPFYESTLNFTTPLNPMGNSLFTFSDVNNNFAMEETKEDLPADQSHYSFSTLTNASTATNNGGATSGYVNLSFVGGVHHGDVGGTQSDVVMGGDDYGDFETASATSGGSSYRPPYVAQPDSGFPQSGPPIQMYNEKNIWTRS